MKITFLGHATLLVETGGHTILIDPFITGNEKAAGKVDIKDLNPDFILLTHAHQDHILDVEPIAKQSGATIVSNYEIAMYYQAKGFEVHPMNHGGTWEFPFGKVMYTQAVHTSSFPDGTYGGQPGGFLLKTEKKIVYIAGDTALTQDMKLIPLWGKLNLAVLPIGDLYTMGPNDSLEAIKLIDPTYVVADHYNTWPPIEQDAAAWAESVKQQTAAQPVVLAPGEAVSV